MVAVLAFFLERRSYLSFLVGLLEGRLVGRAVALVGQPVAPVGKRVAQVGKPVVPVGKPVAPVGKLVAPIGRKVHRPALTVLKCLF